MNEPKRPGSRSAGGLANLRRIAVTAIIISLAVTAALGIIVLLSGDFGDVQARILFTTLLVAGFSITSLCHLAVAARPVRAIGFTGIAVSLIALALGLLLIWGTFEWNEGVGELLRWFAVTSIGAASLAQANLLLLLAGRRSAVVRAGLAATLVAVGIVWIMLAVPILTDGVVGDNETYWRVFGVVAILDALGTIVVPVIGIFLKKDRKTVTDRAASGPMGTETSRTIILPTELAVRADAVAQARGTTMEALVSDALAAELDRTGAE